MRLAPDRLDPAARERASVEADIAATRGLTPSERLQLLADLLAAITPVAKASPNWAAFSAPEPMAPADHARWRGLVARGR